MPEERGTGCWKVCRTPRKRPEKTPPICHPHQRPLPASRRHRRGEARQEIVTAGEIRAMGTVAGLSTAQIADEIHDRCGPLAGTSRIRAYRLALGVSLADLVAQVRAWYASEDGRRRGSARLSCPPTRAARNGQDRASALPVRGVPGRTTRPRVCGPVLLWPGASHRACWACRACPAGAACSGPGAGVGPDAAAGGPARRRAAAGPASSPGPPAHRAFRPGGDPGQPIRSA